MFERYTEKARRVIFFARYEASQFGQPYIETEHILLGLLREDKALTNRFLRTHATVESIRKTIEKNTTIGEKISTSVDLPLSNECKRVLAYAAEEAERLGHKHVGTEHLLLGLLREEGCLAQQILMERGIRLETVREGLANIGVEREARSASARGGAAESERIAGRRLYTDLTQRAIDGELEPVVGRDEELESVIEVLCRSQRRNPMLLGERGVGKTAIVEALAQRIAEGKVPASIVEMRILVLSSEVLSNWSPRREKFDDLAKLLGAVADPANLILFVDGLYGMADARNEVAGQELAGVLRFAIVEAKTRCIGATTEEQYKAACARFPGLDRMFRPLHVRLLDETAVLAALKARKERLEQFHEVTFSDEALECAVQKTGSYLPGKPLPGKALELLDAAGAMVKLRRTEPSEIADAKQRLANAAERLADAIGNHEFEKARFYSDEERKERENLAALRKRHGLEDAEPATVMRADVEQVIQRWSVYPYSL